MKLALGTAQFGSEYGINNKSKPIDADASKAILKYLITKRIDTIDTASTYPNSEKILGISDVSKFKIITKIPSTLNTSLGIERTIRNFIHLSLNNMKLSSIYGVLLHFPEEILHRNGKEIISTLYTLKSEGVIKKIGISIYSPKIIGPILDRFTFDLIQAPLNVFDNRLIKTGWAKRLKELNVEIHVRSSFLQGLLLMKIEDIPPSFKKWTPLFESWSNWLDSNSLNAYDVCIHHLLMHKEIDKIIVGIDNITQLKQLVSSYENNLDISIPDFSSEDEELINPANWSIK